MAASASRAFAEGWRFRPVRMLALALPCPYASSATKATKHTDGWFVRTTPQARLTYTVATPSAMHPVVHPIRADVPCSLAAIVGGSRGERSLRGTVP